MDADALFQVYEETLRDLLDLMLPRHIVRSRPNLTSPWFDDECRSVKRDVRRLERRYRRYVVTIFRGICRIGWLGSPFYERSTISSGRKKTNSGNRQLTTRSRILRSCGAPSQPFSASQLVNQHHRLLPQPSFYHFSN